MLIRSANNAIWYLGGLNSALDSFESANQGYNQIEVKMAKYTSIPLRELKVKLQKLQSGCIEDCIDIKSSSEYAALIHELDIHQIELEIQHRELLQAKSICEEQYERYQNLYGVDHA